MSLRVNGEGDLNSLVAVVGEAPGADEDRIGRPFVGLSGKLQDNYMARVNLTRRDAYFTNVVKERPRNNDISQFITFNRTGRLLTETPEFTAYVKELQEELKKCKANVIVATGNIPLYVLTGKYGISKWRGSILQSRPEFGNRKVIGTLHPAAILRMFGKSSGRFMHTYRMDWERIKEDRLFPELRLPQRKLHTDNSFEQVMEYLHRCLEWDDLLGFDTESSRSLHTGWEMSHIQFALGAQESMCISFTEYHEGIGVVDTYTAKQEAEIMHLASEILESKKVRKVGQNLIYDNYFLYRKYGIIVQNWEDTRIAHKIAYPEMPASLAFLTSIYTREPYYKDDGKMHKIGKSQTTSFQEYAARDAAICVEVFPRIRNVVHRLENDHIYDRHVKSQYTIIYMMEHGMRIDQKRINNLKRGYAKRRQKVYDELQQLCHGVQARAGVQVQDVRPTSNPNARSKKNPLGDIAKYFYETKGLDPYYKRRKSKSEVQKVTVDDEALKRLVRKGHVEARLILDYRRLRKFESTYLNVKQRNGRFHGALDPVGTKQGRMSGSKNSFGEGTNPQNLPNSFRKVLGADPGYLLVEIDGSQAENRTVARVGNVHEILKAFADGVDVHSITASFIFGKPPKQISKEKGSSKLGDGKQSERDWGKRANHAFNYGYGADSFSLKYEIPLDQATQIRNGWLQANKGIEGYWRWVENEITTRRMLTNCFNRTVFFMGTVGTDLYRVAYSCIPQSTVADYILERGICFFHDNEALFLDFHPLNQVHDALWYQVSLELGPEKIVEALRIMKTEFERPIPWKDTSFVIPADFKVGRYFGSLKSFNPMRPDAVATLTKMV